jgi:hypothetical protein
MFIKQLLLLVETKKLSKNCFLFRLDFVLSLNQTILGLLRGHYRHATAISGNITLTLKNIIVTVARFIKFDTTLAGIDVGNTKGFEK